MINEPEREKAIKYLSDALNAAILAQQAMTKSGITFAVNEPNDIAIAQQALKQAMRKVRSF